MDVEELVKKGYTELQASVIHALGLWLFFSQHIDIPDENIDCTGFMKLLDSLGYKIIAKGIGEK